MSNKPGKSYHIKIENHTPWGSQLPCFLHLWINSNTTLQKVDTLLRLIWLECCGHLSALTIRNKNPLAGARLQRVPLLSVFVTCSLIL